MHLYNIHLAQIIVHLHNNSGEHELP